MIKTRKVINVFDSKGMTAQFKQSYSQKSLQTTSQLHTVLPSSRVTK